MVHWLARLAAARVPLARVTKCACPLRRRHANVESLVDQGSSTLRLLVGKSKEFKKAAEAAGAQREWLNSGGFLSGRFGLKTGRKSKAG